MQKKLMLLGGIRYLLPVIKAAHNHGLYVITVDYIPNNIAHKYSDEYHNVSIMDKDAVLQLAEQLNIDGIMSFGVDPGVVTAAYVAEKLGLPSPGSYRSTCILQDKSKFRQFLTDHGFNVPHARGYTKLEDAIADIDFYHWPVIVKPVDSAGSKGVTRVDKPRNLSSAIQYALQEGHNGHFIIEDFLEKEGNSSDCDSFTINGKLVFCSFDDQLFDKEATNPYTPAAYCWPSSMPIWAQEELRCELQRLMTLLNMRTGVYNIETRLCKDGKPYIMEVSPRGGGNRLSEMLQYTTGVDLIDNAVRAAVGEDVDSLYQPIYKGNWAEIILHADKSGRFQNLQINDEVRPYAIEEDLWIKSGDKINNFNGANDAIGTIVLDFDTVENSLLYMKNRDNWLKIIVK